MLISSTKFHHSKAVKMYQRGEKKQTFEYNWKTTTVKWKEGHVKWRDDQRSGEMAYELQRVRWALKA